MARAPNEKAEKAKKLYFKGMKLVEIAKKLNIPAGTVRRWKSTQHWDDELNNDSNGNCNERSSKKTSVRDKSTNARKRGGQRGNNNNFKHGAYKPIYYDNLTDEEKEMFSSVPDDPEKLLTDQIALLSIRENRLMSSIAYYTGEWTAVQDKLIPSRANRVITSTQFENSHGSQSNNKVTTVESEKTDAINVIEKLESELTKVQRQKTKAIESLARLRREKAMNSEGNIIIPIVIEGGENLES